MISEMTEEERTRYNIFQSQTCRFPKNKVKSLMQNAVPGVQVQNKAVTVASFAVRLFSAELIELAREISGNEEPLTPDLIMIALNEIIDKGTIPGLEVISGDEEDLQANIEEYGPACVAIDASHWSFQLYTSGIYDEPRCSSTALDHCVGCVGFGVEGTTNYWIVRDSWGESWGEDGYIRMIKNKNNQCGIETDAVIPIA
ncbi:Clan CA, family C1, cathepsin L-like cysteine peptidase [Histomonas meleagridis]|uniref:Clan CA, family C1, cathepsin L-like cysteine peptidase n=1 Tax=Histomonas meleagridis TaxID=135588 RepID=UPI00355A7950|nr:Clan CA, family C1, cathepsin L-like cysteine peptidase [Histomonas meleagridis]KAH0797958.1 Clan CA, family C1, cathepsin L-like cysteine peptidase [Histomonas meleagridis]